MGVSRLSTKRAALLAVVVAVASCGLLFAISGVSSELHLVPREYVGRIVVTWNDPKGAEIVRDDNGRVVYRFDTSGVLRFRDPRPSGWSGLIDVQRYYVDSAGHLMLIPEGGSYDYRRELTNEVETFKHTVGTAGKLHWYAYCVGTPAVGNACASFFDAGVARAIGGGPASDAALTVLENRKENE